MDERDCEMPGELLSSLIDDELVGQQRLLVAEHAANCDACCLQLGRLVAAKEAMRREAPLLSEVPTDLLARLRTELDEVDRVARAADMRAARGRSRYIPALAVMGVFLTLLAFGYRQRVLRTGAGPDIFIRAHEAAGSGLVMFGDPQTTYNAVSVGNGCGPWRPVWQGLLQQDNAVIRQTVYYAGRLPVSSFYVPVDFFDTRDMHVITATPSGDGIWVGEYCGGSVAAIPHGTCWEVLVARTSPDHLASLAGTRSISGAPSEGY